MDLASQAKVSPVGVLSDCQRSSPSNTPAYCLVNIPELIEESMVSCTSAGVGQMSFRYTSEPSEPVPSESFSKSKSIVPASA